MKIIVAQLQKIQSEKRLGLMTHIVVGYPSIDESRALVMAMAEAGVDFIELQIPFSDPVADGPTLMQANQIALEGGVTVRAAMELMAELAPRVGIPLIFMTYFNIVHHYGAERFCADAAAAGASGLIVPDIPLDEEPQEHFISATEKHDITAVRLLSPASTEHRLKLNAGLAKDFVYFVSRKGITGAQSELDSELRSHLQRVKQFITVPLAVGFGISKPEHLETLKGHAEIAVIGSAVLNAYNQAGPGKGVGAVKNFISGLVRVGGL